MGTIDRRDFLKLVGAGGVGAAAGFVLAEAIKHPVEHLIPYPVPPEDFSPGVAAWYNTVCSMCPAGCGISVRTLEGRAKKIEGNPSHPVNQGRLCALGQAGLQVLYNPDRLTGPLMRTGARGSGPFVQTTWDDGIAELAGRLNGLRADGRSDRVSFLTAGVRGHLAALLELLMAELPGARLLQYDFDHPHTLLAANERFFGAGSLPYYDLENARYVLSFGADYLGGWLSPVHHALGFGRSRQGRSGARGRFVQVEPRMSLSGAAADEWIPARPGMEGFLALGIARQLIAEGGYEGADRDAWAAALDGHTADAVAAQTGVPAATIRRLAGDFAGTRPSLALGGGAMGGHTNGVDALVAVNALNYLAGNVGRPGGVLFNPPPAFGPRARAAHASYRDMLALAEDARRGRIEILVVSDTNPVFTLPAAAGFAEALAAIPYIVSLSSFMDETTGLADRVLPSHTYLESWGDDSPEPGVGFTVGAIAQPVVAPLYDTRSKGDILLGIARALGAGEDFPWANMEDYLKAGWREVYGRAPIPAGAGGFEAFWISVLRAGVWGEKGRRESGSPAVEARVIDAVGVAPPEFAGSSDEFPFVLHPYLSHTLRDGRGANLPWMQELPDPMTSVLYGSWVELNPATAERLGLREGDVVDVESAHGKIGAPVYVFPAIMPDVVAMPIGQGHAGYGRYASRRGANPIQLLAPLTEPVTGGLASSATRVRLVPTGRRVSLVKQGGESRQLGRGIVRTTGAAAVTGPGARLASIPIKVEST